MKTKHKVIIGIIAALTVITVISVYISKQPIPVMQPTGAVGEKERNLIVFAAVLSLAIVVPVFTLLGVFAYKYRETSKKAKYTPQLGGSKLAETVWWVVPSVLIIVISVVTWQSSYALDPYKPVANKAQPLHVQVVSLDWKWLFIYPDQRIASVNRLNLPANTPVTFDITSDTVMNSFWIPSLGGQMYAMPGMNTQLNLIANKEGVYTGRSANVSGTGFAGMTFQTQVTSPGAFDEWVRTVRSGGNVDSSIKPKLDSAAYHALAKPSQNNPATSYANVTSDLYDTIMMNYMMPNGSFAGGGSE